jgi:hypothetical protein
MDSFPNIKKKNIIYKMPNNNGEMRNILIIIKAIA